MMSQMPPPAAMSREEHDEPESFDCFANLGFYVQPRLRVKIEPLIQQGLGSVIFFFRAFADRFLSALCSRLFPGVTHVVCDENYIEENPLVAELAPHSLSVAIHQKRTGIHAFWPSYRVVSPGWVRSSIMEGRRLSEDTYMEMTQSRPSQIDKMQHRPVHTPTSDPPPPPCPLDTPLSPSLRFTPIARSRSLAPVPPSTSTFRPHHPGPPTLAHSGRSLTPVPPGTPPMRTSLSPMRLHPHSPGPLETPRSTPAVTAGSFRRETSCSQPSEDRRSGTVCPLDLNGSFSATAGGAIRPMGSPL